MSFVEPITFWEAYRDQLRALGSWAAYQTSSEWTKIATEAAIEACREFGLAADREYLRLDVMGYHQTRPGTWYDWHLRIAFEHENGDNWNDELCKLAHVVADLRVLVAYHDYTKSEDPLTRLQSEIHRLGERIHRVPNSNWLFIFGPRQSAPERTFMAYTFDSSMQLAALHDEAPFAPQEWLDRQS
ncbi:MAG: hypothetical protein IIB53_16370 [Planctomycetes bacterium]|nr:hypothetical protein [Planctomycetota bacterium]